MGDWITAISIPFILWQALRLGGSLAFGIQTRDPFIKLLIGIGIGLVGRLLAITFGLADPSVWP